MEEITNAAMDISLSDAVNIARKWESEETKVNAYMEIHSPRVAIRFNGCIVRAQPDRIGIFAESSQFELSAASLSSMTCKYSESEGENPGKSILEITALTWRLVLFE